MLNSGSNMDLLTTIATATTTTTSTTVSSLITTKATNTAIPTVMGDSGVEEPTEVNETPPDPFEILRIECYARLNQTAAAATTTASSVGTTGKV